MTNTALTGATPAACFAHSVSRKSTVELCPLYRIGRSTRFPAAGGNRERSRVDRTQVEIKPARRPYVG
ncbi:MAG: hypothetical protein ACREIA_12740 [Opitutaceae bacterium]